MPKKIVALLLIFLTIACACSKPKHKYVMSVSTGLADNGTIQIALEVLFDDKADLEAFKKDSGQIKYAIKLMLSGYDSKEVVNKGVTNNTIQRLITSRFKLKFDKVNINDFVVKDEKDKKVVQETVFTPSK